VLKEHAHAIIYFFYYLGKKLFNTADRLGYKSGLAVYRYLSSERDEYYTRDTEKYIVPTKSGREIVEKMS